MGKGKGTTVNGEIDMKKVNNRRISAADTPSGDKNEIKDNEKYQNAVTGKLEILVADIASIKEDMFAITGAIYGSRTVNQSVKATTLLGKLNNVELNNTPLKGLMKVVKDSNKKYEKLFTTLDNQYQTLNTIVETLKVLSANSNNDNKSNKQNNTAIAGNTSCIDLDEPLQNLSNNIIEYIEFELKLKEIITTSLDDIKRIISDYYKGFEGKLHSSIDNLKGKVDLIVTGIDKGTVDSLVELFSIKYDKNIIFGNELFTENFAKNMSNYNNIIASISKIDTDLILDALDNISELKEITGNDYTWLDGKRISNRLENMSKALTSFSKIITKLEDCASAVITIDMLREYYTNAVNSLYRILIKGTARNASIVSILEYKYNWKSDKLILINNAIEKLGKIFTTLTVTGIKAVFATFGANAAIKLLNKLTKTDGKTKSLFDVIKGLPKIKKEDINKITAISTVFDAITNIAKKGAIFLLFILPAMIGLKFVKPFIKLLKHVIDELSIIADPKKLKDSAKTLKEFGKLLLIMGGLALFAAFTGGFLLTHITQIMAFTFILATFMFVTIGAFNLASKGIKDAMQHASSFSKLLIVSSVLLVVGALIGGWLGSNIGSIAIFTVTLAAFIFATVFAYKWAANDIGDSLKYAKDFALLTAVSALTLMIGAKLLTASDIVGAFFFALAVGFFVAVMAKAYEYVAKKLNRKTIKALYQFLDMVVISALTLMIGALFMAIPGAIKNAILFTGLLTLFIRGVTWAYSKNAKGMRSALKYAPAFAALIAISAITLLVGGLILAKNPTLLGWIPAFGALLCGFIWLVTYAYSKNSKKIAKSFLPAIGLAYLVALSGAILIVAGKLLTLEQLGIALGFALGLAVFIGAMGFICYFLNKKKDDIFKGIILMAGICIITALGGVALYILAKAYNVFGGFGNALLAVITFAGTILVLAVMAALIAPLWEFILIGAGCMAALVVVAYLGGLALEQIANAMIKMKEASDFDSNKILAAIGNFMLIVGALMPLANPITLIGVKMAASTMDSASIAIANMARTMQQIASLNIPIYEGTKVVGYKKMQSSDFIKAANNAKTIITTLGRAIIEVYKSDKDIFDTGFLGLSETPFSIVVRSCTGLGSMLSKIAKSVKDYASLVIPEYNGGKEIVSYRKLEDKDFINAGKNVKRIITTLGRAIIDIYNDPKAKPMFETSGGIFGWGEKSVFTKVVNSCSGLGQMLSLISSGVKDYASLVVPEYNGGTEITSYRKLEENDFKNAATNVKKIITTLGGAIISIYNDPLAKPMFETSGGILGWGAKSVFTKVVNSCTGLGEMLSLIATSVKDYASLVVPIYGNNGLEITGYRPLKKDDFDLAAENVETIITTLGNAIITTYQKNPIMFESKGGILGWGSETPFTKVVKSCTGMGNMITMIATAVKDYANLRVNTYNDDGTISGTREMKKEDFTNAAIHIKEIITILGQALLDTFDEYSEWFEDPSWFGKKAENSKFGMLIAGCSGMGKMISNVANAVKNFSELRITQYGADGKPNGKFTLLKDADFNGIGDKISKIMTAIGTGLMEAFGKHKEWFEDPSWFGKKAENSPFYILMTSTKGMGGLVSGVAKAITDIANMKYIDPTTKKEAILSDAQITKAGTTIGKIFSTLFDALGKQYETYSAEGKILSNKGEKMNVIKEYITNAKSVVDVACGVITKIASVKIGDEQISSKMFDETNKDSIGKLIENVFNVIPKAVNGSTISDSDVEKAKELSEKYPEYITLYESVSEIWDNIRKLYTKENLDILSKLSVGDNNDLHKLLWTIFRSVRKGKGDYFGNVNPKYMATSLETLNELFNTLAVMYTDVISTLVGDDVQKIYKQIVIKENNKDINIVKRLLEEIGKTIDGVNIPDPGDNLKNNIVKCNDVISAASSVYQQLNNMLDNIGGREKLDILKQQITTLFVPISTFINNILSTNIDYRKLEQFNIDSAGITTAINTLVAIVSSINRVKSFDNFDNLPSKVITYINVIKNLLSNDINRFNYAGLKRLNDEQLTIESAINNIVRMNRIMAENDFSNLQTFEDVANNYKNGIIAMGQAYSELNSLNGSKLFGNLIDKLFGTGTEEDIFARALQGINNVISKVEFKNVDNFNKEATGLENFVKSINKIDIGKANTVTSLIETLNTLADNMGNLDGLTDAISTKLTSVLNMLTAELKASSETFSTAERIQTARHKFIKESIKDIEKLLNDPLEVEVKLNNIINTSGSSSSPSGTSSGSTSGTQQPNNNNSSTTSSSGSSSAGDTYEDNSAIANNHGTPSSNNGYNYSRPTSDNTLITPFNTNNASNSNIKNVVKSAMEEMILKYNLDGNTARGNAKS